MPVACHSSSRSPIFTLPSQCTSHPLMLMPTRTLSLTTYNAGSGKRRRTAKSFEPVAVKKIKSTKPTVDVYEGITLRLAGVLAPNSQLVIYSGGFRELADCLEQDLEALNEVCLGAGASDEQYLRAMENPDGLLQWRRPSRH